MTPKKQDKLYSEYPKLFCQKDLKPNQTLMTNGIAVGDGWYDIIAELCQELEDYSTSRLADLSFKPPEFFQIKNSFGELAIRLTEHDEYANKLVEKAQSHARVTCEVCGNFGSERPFRGWHKVACLPCFNKIPFWQL